MSVRKQVIAFFKETHPSVEKFETTVKLVVASHDLKD